jgi:hypothetical protein
MKTNIARRMDSSGPQKRGGFVESGQPKPPFAPMRGVGEGNNKLHYEEWPNKVTFLQDDEVQGLMLLLGIMPKEKAHEDPAEL